VDLRIASYPLPGTQAFGCLAEALLLGLENIDTDEFTGPVTVDKVVRTRRWAEKHGFSLVDVKRSCVLASEGPR
ncbi:MAG TPA: hypothetical protein PLV92_05825, partial [Pirellulaceae bacterium]|nr:hypothetical protein [Pirellulaceae bacterium]